MKGSRKVWRGQIVAGGNSSSGFGLHPAGSEGALGDFSQEDESGSRIQARARSLFLGLLSLT